MRVALARTRTGRLRSVNLAEVLEKSFVVFALLLFMGAVLPLFRQPTLPGLVASGGPEGRDLFSQMLFLCVYVVTFVLVVTRWKKLVRVLTSDKLLLLLVSLALVSLFWSAAPGLTLQRGVALLGTTLFGAYLATRYTLNQQLRLLAWGLGLAAIFSVIFALVLPYYGISSGAQTVGELPTERTARAWRGVFSTNNVLGRLMVLGAVVFLLTVLQRKRQLLAWAGFGLCSVLILLANSATALMILLTLLALLPLYTALRWRRNFFVPMLIFTTLLGGSVASLIISNPEALLDVLGRDITLTGRTELWKASLEMIWQRPFLGYGYNAFWLGWEGGSSYVWLITGYEMPHAHNGFLDLWLDLGLLGVSIFALWLVSNLVRGVGLIRASRGLEGTWPLLYLTFITFYNLTESAILSRNSIFWVLFVAIALSLRFPRSSTLVTHEYTLKRSFLDGSPKESDRSEQTS